MPRVFAAILLVVVLVVGGGIIATTAYQAGVSTAVTTTTTTTATGTVAAPVVVPAYGYGWGWGWHPWFGFFGFFIGLFFLFLIFGLIRAIFWRGGSGRRGDWGGGWVGNDSSGPGASSGTSGSEARAHKNFDDWHRRAHDPTLPPTDPTDRSTGA
jgi:putative membrane protein